MLSRGMAPAIHHLALRTPDLERCARFYTAVLGMAERERKYDPAGALRAIWLRAGAAVLMLERREVHEPAVPPGAMDFVAFSVTVAEREALRARLGDLGVGLEAETAHTLYLRDPDGRRVGVSSYPL